MTPVSFGCFLLWCVLVSPFTLTDFVRIPQEQALGSVSLGMNPTKFKLFMPLWWLALTSLEAGHLVFFWSNLFPEALAERSDFRLWSVELNSILPLNLTLYHSWDPYSIFCEISQQRSQASKIRHSFPDSTISLLWPWVSHWLSLGISLPNCTIRRLDGKCLRSSFGSDIQRFHAMSATFPSDSGSYIIRRGRWRVLAHPWISISPWLTQRGQETSSHFTKSGQWLRGVGNNLLSALMGRGALMRLTGIVIPSPPQPVLGMCWPFSGRWIPPCRGKRWPVLQVPDISC